MAELPVSAEEWGQRLLAVHGATETEAFFGAVFRLLEGTVDCDWVLATMRAVDHMPMVARDSLGRSFEAEYMERIMAVNPTVGALMASPGVRVLRSAETLPKGVELEGHPFYEECMKPLGWMHSVGMFFWSVTPPVPGTTFSVFRREGRNDFTAEEAERLTALHGHIGTALRRLQAELGGASALEATARLLDDLPMGASVWDWGLGLMRENEEARRLRERWQGGGADGLPAEIGEACGRLRAAWKEAIRADGQGRVVRRVGVENAREPQLTAEVSLVQRQGSLLAEPVFVVRFVEVPVSRRLEMLTDAEREVVLPLATGLDNQTLAERLGISLAAVKARLHGAFRKLGVEHRTQLMALIMKETERKREDVR